MRTDVKVGIALGAIVLVVAVSYYGTKKEGDIQLADSASAVRAQNEKTIEGLFQQRKPPGQVHASGSVDLSEPKAAKPNARTTRSTKPSAGGSKQVASDTPDETSLTTKLPPTNDQVTSMQGDKGADRPESSRPVSTPLSLPPPAPQRQTVPGDDALAGQESRTTTFQPPNEGNKTTLSDMPARSVPQLARSGQPRVIKPLPKPKPVIRTHVIEQGDSFALLADRYYGSQRYARYLADANPGLDPYRLLVGTKIKIPPSPGTSRSAIQRSTEGGKIERGHYVVKKGDTLYDIARRELGSGIRWTEIYEFNRATIGNDPADLKVGTILKVPAG